MAFNVVAIPVCHCDPETRRVIECGMLVVNIHTGEVTFAAPTKTKGSLEAAGLVGCTVADRLVEVTEREFCDLEAGNEETT